MTAAWGRMSLTFMTCVEHIFDIFNLIWDPNSKFIEFPRVMES